MSGYYSLVQYMPDPERAEAVNVGVLLLDTRDRAFRFIVTRPVRRIQRAFPGTSSKEIAAEVIRFYNTVMALDFNELDDLTEFCLTQRGVLRCLEPRWVDIPRGDLQLTLHHLLSRLVLE